jgi:Trk K+ transport system NAD-binding subunit
MPAPPSTGTSPPGQHSIVCGDSQLAYRIALELTSRYRERVTVLMTSRTARHGPDISALPGVTVLERAALTSEAFDEAGVRTARAVALVAQDDIGNFHAGLRVQELNPGIRLVIAVFNRRLGEHIRGFFPDCTVLSGTAMAAPSFVASALGEPEPSHVRVSGRTLYVARAAAVPAGHVVCGLSVPDDSAGVAQLLPPESLDSDGARLVLAVADGTPRDPLAMQRHPVRAAVRVVRRLVWNKFGLLFGLGLAAAVIGFTLLLSTGVYSFATAGYLAVMDLTGSAVTGGQVRHAEKFAQMILTVDGMAMLPVVTALIVGARITGSARSAPRPRAGHVIVAGLGNVGTRIVGELHDLGFPVACVDSDPRARGIPMARRFGIPVVVGDAYNETVLRSAGLDGAIALVSVTDSDMVNLETALTARAIRHDLRLVVRLYDDDLAQRVQRTVGNIVSRSVAYMAAPSFAAAMLEHQVLRTIAVDRHVLLIADVPVAPGTDIAGRSLADLERDGLARVLALHSRSAPAAPDGSGAGTGGGGGRVGRPNWSPPRDYVLVPGDRVTVVGTRAGLGVFLADARPAPSSL